MSSLARTIVNIHLVRCSHNIWANYVTVPWSLSLIPACHVTTIRIAGALFGHCSSCAYERPPCRWHALKVYSTVSSCRFAGLRSILRYAAETLDGASLISLTSLARTCQALRPYCAGFVESFAHRNPSVPARSLLGAISRYFPCSFSL